MLNENRPDDVVIVSALRTPFGRFDGVLKNTLSIDLGVKVLGEVCSRVQVAPSEVDEVYYGTCIPAEYALYTNVPARQATLLAGFPEDSISLTIDRACCSSMTALRLGFQSIKAGTAECVIASGAESMGNTPLIAQAAKARWGSRLGPVELEDVLFELGYSRKGFAPVAKDAGEVAIEFGVSREEQDAWSLQSQRRWFEAFAAGKYQAGEEILPLEIPQRKGEPLPFDRDESPRQTSMDKLAKLRTIYGSPTVTAGNAPGMNSGASAIMLMTRAKAAARGLDVLATLEAVQAAAGSPKYMACIPAEAIKKIMARRQLTVDDLDLLEINEAFAAVTLVSLKMLAEGGETRLKQLKAKTNVNGGAIAMGHPVGASGARIAMALIYELRRRGGGSGAAAICGGPSQGEAVLLTA